MPHLLRVKKENVDDFKGLFPYNPFNRLVYEPLGIYLESGFIDLVFKGFYNPKTYTPAIIDINLSITPIVGFLFFTFKIINASVVGLDNLCKFNEIESLRFTTKGDVRESKALNCDVKTDELTMVDPRGEGVDCTAAFVPRIPPYPPLGSGFTLTSNMTYIEVFAINVLSPTVRHNAVRESCVDRNVIELEYKGEEKIYCPVDILYKKFCQNKFPPSLFSGKLKLYIQSIYGGNYIEYKNEQGDYIESLYIGPYFGRDSGMAARTAIFTRGTHILHTDSLGNYYLINTASWSINPIVPNNYGRLLKRHILKTNPTGVIKDAYEAYVLTTCLPTTSLAHIKNAVGFGSYGIPLDFRWKANWQGNKLSAVALKKNESHRRISSLLTTTIDSSGISQLYEDEIERKKENLRLQEARKKDTYIQETGVFQIYATTATLVFKEATLEGDGALECFDGDIEDGLWFYSVLGFSSKFPTNDEVAEKEALEEEAKKLNKIYGKLPYSKEFYDELPDYFEATLEVLETTPPWLEPLQTDKIFVWDSYLKDYEWRVGCNPFEVEGKACPPASSSGTFPVYCWYDKQDALQVVSYTIRSVNASDNNIVPPEGLCGPGSDYYLTETFSGGIVSGFQVNHFSDVSMSGASHTTIEGNMSVSGGSWSGCWVGGCGPSPGCDSDGASGGTGINGCWGFFFTSWGQTKSGSANTKEKSSSGNLGHHSYLAIPSDDAEGVFLGHQETKTKSGSNTISLANNSLVVAKKESGIVAHWGEKKSIKQSHGWQVCIGIWFCHSWGNNGSCGGPTEFSCCWCGFYPGNPPIDVPYRAWGPSGPDTPVVVSNVDPYGGYTSVTSTQFFEGVVLFKSYYVGKDGKKITLLEKEASTSDPNKLYIPNLGDYNNFVKWIDLRWPYASSGNSFGCMQTVQNLKIIRAPLATTTDPQKFPYKEGFNHPVGYV